MHGQATAHCRVRVLSSPEWSANSVAHTQDNECGDLTEIPKHHIFAFQEMNRESGKPNNDKNIFAAVTSLMKAQAYELGSRRGPKAARYQLISYLLSTRT